LAALSINYVYFGRPKIEKRDRGLHTLLKTPTSRSILLATICHLGIE